MKFISTTNNLATFAALLLCTALSSQGIEAATNIDNGGESVAATTSQLKPTRLIRGSAAIRGVEEAIGEPHRRELAKGHENKKSKLPKMKNLIHIQNHCLAVGSTDAQCTESHALNAVTNALNDYQSRGLTINEDFVVVVLLNGPGAIFALDPSAAAPNARASENHSLAHVQNLIAAGVTFYVCSNSANSMGVTEGQLIQGITTVPAGITTALDLQRRGYSYYPAL